MIEYHTRNAHSLTLVYHKNHSFATEMDIHQILSLQTHFYLDFLHEYRLTVWVREKMMGNLALAQLLLQPVDNILDMLEARKWDQKRT